MLKDKKVKIQAVAYEAGFNDAPFFIKKFKKATGLTPREYRSLHSDGDNTAG